jgi:TPR repeat protein
MNYVDDKGGISDPREARLWFEKALASGYRGATAHLAKILIEHTSPPEASRALELLRAGADDNDFGSLMKLSRIYGDGLLGVSPDQEKAGAYLRLAKDAMQQDR